MASKAEVEVLMSLGLTSCQAKVYLALCTFGVLDIKTISNHANVPRADIYRMTENLMKNGLVEKIISRPTTFQAIQFDKAVSFLLKKRREETEKIESKTRKVLKNFPKNQIKIESPKSDYILLPGREQIDKNARDSINGTETCIDFVTPWKRLKHLLIFTETMKRAQSRGVKFRFITEKPEESRIYKFFLDFCSKSSLCQVRYLPSAPKMSMGICDRKKAIVVTDPEKGLYESSALLINNPSLLSIIQDFFDILWITALKKQQYSLNGEQV